MSPADPSYPNEQNCWKNFEGLCLRRQCQRYLRAEHGLFCANFYSARGKFAPCLGAWCPECYIGGGLVKFPVTSMVDADGVDLATEAEKTRFKISRARDHLMTPIQCELCHFHREPTKYDFEDVEVLEFIHQCCKDALWSREISTVENNLREAIRGRKAARRFRFLGSTPIPLMGPFPLEDKSRSCCSGTVFGSWKTRQICSMGHLPKS
jgi:hypothetical protein